MKSKGLIVAGLSLLLAAFLALGAATRLAQASGNMQNEANIVRGAMLYDNWFAALGVDAPAGSMPIWARQTTNTRSGEDTWRCVSCHGWDYLGKDGAYRSSSGNYTGFPGLLATAEGKSVDELVANLKGSLDPDHDFSSYLDDASLNDLAGFLNSALIDDSLYIDAQTLSVKDGNSAQGKTLYDAQCARCHGEDGSTLKFRFEGRDATLGTLAVVDPWRFLHKTRFGTPGTEMVIGYDLGWQPQDGRDVLLYAQSLPTGLETQPEAPSLSGREGETGQPGGPAQNLFTGILTALGAMATSLGFALVLGIFLIGVIFVVVWLVRGKSK
jgi:mono/diheme cytochrome c family protein